MHLSVYTINGTSFEGSVEKVTLRTTQGQITVLDNHIPLITLVESAPISYYTSRDGWVELPFSGGIAEVRPQSEVVILAK